MKDYYYILGTPADCSEQELREAYDKLSQKFHPDVNPDDTYYLSRYREVSEAYTTLGNPARRLQYDKKLKAAGLYRTRAGSARRRLSGITVVNLLFTLVLITLTAIFGAYVYKSISGSKPKTTIPSTVVTMPIVRAPARHISKKQKHKLRVKPVYRAAYARHRADTVMPTAMPVVPAKGLPQVIAQPQPAALAALAEKPDYLYTSYLKANETGIINLRDDKYYNARVMATIPSNTKVWVMEEDGRYYKVRYGQLVGYVPAWTVVR